MSASGLPLYDVIIVGAGPVGLSAALVLGRSRRHVLVCSAGEHRNAALLARCTGFLPEMELTLESCCALAANSLIVMTRSKSRILGSLISKLIAIASRCV